MKHLEERLKEVNPTWDKDQIIRYLYVKLAPFFERDLDYFMSTEEEQMRMYQEGFKQNSKFVVCQTICEQYEQIYDEFNIKSRVIQTNVKQIPHYGLIVKGDHGWYYLDPLKDLFANQLGLKTEFFAATPGRYSHNIVKECYPYLIDLPSEYVENMDHELGLNYHGIYMDSFFNQLHDEITSNKIFEYFDVEKGHQFEIMKKKLDFICEYLLHMGHVPGIYERNILWQYLIYMVFNRRERQFITSEILRTEDFYEIAVQLSPKTDEADELHFREIKDQHKRYVLEKIKNQK